VPALKFGCAGCFNNTTTLKVFDCVARLEDSLCVSACDNCANAHYANPVQ
jgi:hypothetical protein